MASRPLTSKASRILRVDASHSTFASSSTPSSSPRRLRPTSTRIPAREPAFQWRVLETKKKKRGRGRRENTGDFLVTSAGDEKTVWNAGDGGEFESETISKNIRLLTRERLTKLVSELQLEESASGLGRETAVDSAAETTTTTSGALTQKQVRKKLARALRVLESGLVERGTEARLVLLAACCGEHLLLIGPPGTAKSEVARRLGSIVSSDAMFFQRVLTRFSVPEELFGPLSLQMLEQDVYRRNTAGYLPEAEVAFIDEVFKANSAVLNALLMILNEKRFDNGNEQVSVPLVCLVGASNELPSDPELQALYDRFLFRKMVNPVSDYGIQQLLSSGGVEGAREDADADPDGGDGDEEEDLDLQSTWLEELNASAQSSVRVPGRVIDILARLRSHLMEECEPPIYISDRRLLKCINMLKMCAFTNGRSQVSEFDMLLLKHVCWSSPEEQGKVDDWIIDQLISQTETKQLRYLLLGVFTRCCKSMNSNSGEGSGSAGSVSGSDVASDVENLVEILTNKFASMQEQMYTLNHLVSDNIWLCEEEATAVAGQLQKPLESSIKQVEALLIDALTIESSFKEQIPLYVVADLLPDYWSDFIRKGDIEDVKPLGLKPLP